MSIELELRLAGEDANEDSLEDLIDWLERANINGLEVKRKELPPAKGDMGFVPDIDTIVTCLQTFDDFKSLLEFLKTWYGYNHIMICPKLQTISEQLLGNDPKIQAMVEQIRTLFCKEKQ
ncbi:hypothetical protein QUF74_00410 [Candidatus Halobeggiatoa sp. HSG11]|nr:hypothetical protein [Candidatus Halobeggiatoa sp. HSG11]